MPTPRAYDPCPPSSSRSTSPSRRVGPMADPRNPARPTRKAGTTMSSTPTAPSVDTGAPDVAASESPRHAEPDARLLRALADLDNLRKRYEARLAHEAED